MPAQSAINRADDLRLAKGASGAFPTIPTRLVEVRHKDIIHCQKFDVIHLLRQSFQIVAKFLIDLFERRFQSTLSTTVADWRDEDGVAVSREFQRCFGGDL